jgi:hypothetical protein
MYACLIIKWGYWFPLHDVPDPFVLEIDLHCIGPHGEVVAGEYGNLYHVFFFLPSEGWNNDIALGSCCLLIVAFGSAFVRISALERDAMEGGKS